MKELTKRSKYELPEYGEDVLAIVQHNFTGNKRYDILHIGFEEDEGVVWIKSNTLDYVDRIYKVIAWDYLPEIK